MQLQPFDLNDILHEPSDEQLDDLMEAVAAAARRHADAARAQLMLRLQAESRRSISLSAARHDPRGETPVDHRRRAQRFRARPRSRSNS